MLKSVSVCWKIAVDPFFLFVCFPPLPPPLLTLQSASSTWSTHIRTSPASAVMLTWWNVRWSPCQILTAGLWRMIFYLMVCGTKTPASTCSETSELWKPASMILIALNCSFRSSGWIPKLKPFNRKNRAACMCGKSINMILQCRPRRPHLDSSRPRSQPLQSLQSILSTYDTEPRHHPAQKFPTWDREGR